MLQTFRILLFIFLLPLLSYGQKSISLAGEWEVAFDSDDAGSHRFLKRKFSGKINLPGTTDEASMGDTIKFKPSLTRESLYQLARRHRFVGTAWYKRTIEIPTAWEGQEIELYLERVLWQSRIFIDGKEAHAQQESLTTPHRYNLTDMLTPGSHTILMRINNTRQYDISYQNLAHAYTDGTQTIWNGVIGKIDLAVKTPVNIQHIQTFPNSKDKLVTARIKFQNKTGHAIKGKLNLAAKLNGKNLPVNEQIVQVDTGVFVYEVKYDLQTNFQNWDEFSPSVYQLDASFIYDNEKISSYQTTFGVRQLSNENSVLHVNGRRIFLRGTLESAIFPLTGHPPTDKSGWLKVFNTAKLYGLNHLRFHSWCPPKAAFDVADSLGFYLQVELPMWSLQVGEDPKADKFISDEATRIGEEYGNHPSFCFWSMGNELEGNFDFLNNLVTKLKKADPRHLYTTTTYSFQPPHGKWPEPADDYFVTQETKLGWVRGQGIFNQKSPSFIEDYASSLIGLTVPVVTHEVGQYAVFPNIAEISKYTGVMAPVNLIAIRDDLKKKGMIPLADAYLKASGKLAALLYKEEMERILRTKGASGIQLLDLHDFPGQGTADIGLLDAFWDSKGIISPTEFRAFCSPVVPLLRFEKATYTNQETFRATAELANFGGASLHNIIPEWTLSDDSGKLLFSGRLPGKTVDVGNGISLGAIEVNLGSIKTAKKLTLKLALKNTPYANTWHIWVYPKDLPDMHSDVVITQSPEEAILALANGKKVLLNPDYKKLNGLPGKFIPLFWSPVHFPEQAGATGLLCDPKHPALKEFPTDFHADWQWWDLCTQSTAIILPDSSLSPIVRQIDNFANNRQLANVFEAAVGDGRLLVCSFDISTNLEGRPVARQFRHSLLKYMNSATFSPKDSMSADKLLSIVNLTGK
ncbi:glycoside hydrolase family 2 [Dyadobacter sp. CY345]|uniref:sugar-binding domain-containing protein n=1 Tax=Dyadobacter sp. CY345 TaxID=2909335 RepID=UPI001F42113D|nr:sugar-binding domain-containing protein [Dyadobacter sp. CY345]MCF2443419.1 glycoside hydrolase family 2 [Dyadobacter sp. CY345]